MADSVIKDTSEKYVLRISKAGLSGSHCPETPFHHKITQIHYVSGFRLPAGTKQIPGVQNARVDQERLFYWVNVITKKKKLKQRQHNVRPC